MQDGKVTMPYKNFLGYKKGEDGMPEIVGDEAEIVRKIYRLFLEGKATSWIANHLTAEGIPTPCRKVKWRDSTVISILTNEKYRGDALLQKSFVTDFLTKKTKINEGEIPQYYVEGSHPAIVTPEVQALAQQEMIKRKSDKNYKTGISIFSGKIICDECDGVFGSKVWHSNSKYRRTIWRCNHKYDKSDKCETPHLSEDDIKEAFIAEYNGMIENKANLLIVLEETVTNLLDTKKPEEEVLRLQAELSGTAEIMSVMVKENARLPADQDEYNKKYSKLAARYEDLKTKLEAAEKNLCVRRDKIDRMERFIKNLKGCKKLLTEFNEGLWHSSVEAVRVDKDGGMRFIFRGGIPG